MKKVLVIGKGGQVSDNLISLLQNQYDFEFKALGRDELDLSKPQDVYSKLSFINFKPDVIINAAAYTAVDKAEEERDICNNTNNISVAEIAKYATKVQALLVHYSTDYVFNGLGTAPFAEDDTASLQPLNYYGETKLLGEKAVIKSGANHLIFRTSWVYNHEGKNFVRTILKLAQEREELKIVADQIGSPTYAYDIAMITLAAISAEKIKTGIYHLVPNQQISWHQFAQMIVTQAAEAGFTILTKNIVPLTSAQYPTPARRPLNSRLATEKLRINFGLQLPPIAASLQDCLQKIKSQG